MSETNEMIEKVAKAMADRDGTPWESIPPNGGRRNMFRSYARAALEAIRNADNDMLAAMHRAMFTDPYDATNLPMLGAGFEAAIDAALSPNKETDR